MKQTTALEVIEDMEEGKKIFVVFKSPYCHYCQALEPVLEYLQRTNKDLDMRYIDTQSDDFGVFEDHIDGVPSIALVSEGKFSILEEPTEPHETTWYTTDYLNKAAKSIRNLFQIRLVPSKSSSWKKALNLLRILKRFRKVPRAISSIKII